MKAIFEYFDYRRFLQDYYTYKKNRNRYFSYRYFARAANIKSPVFFKEVAEGKKNLSRPMIEKFSTALQFGNREATYFKYLVLFNQAKTAKDKQEHYAILRSIEKTKSEKTLSSDQYDYFSNWYTLVIRELVTLYDFGDNFKLLAATVHPPIKPSEAKASVKLLLKLGLIKKRLDGFYEQTDTAITAKSGIASLAIRQCNKTMALHAAAAIEDFPKSDRTIFGITIGISQEMREIINAEIAAFKDRIVTLVSRDKTSDQVCQLNMQLFPVSRRCPSPAKEGVSDE